MDDGDGFRSESEYVPFYPEDSDLVGMNLRFTCNCTHFHSRVEKQQVAENVGNLGSVELIFRNSTRGFHERDFMLFTNGNLAQDTEFSVRLYWSRDGDPNLYGIHGYCPEIHFQMVQGFAVAISAAWSDLYTSAGKMVGRLIAYMPFTQGVPLWPKAEPDVVIASVNKGDIKLHSRDDHVVTCRQDLSSHSPVFSAMFKSNFRERAAEDINLNYVGRGVLDLLMACINQQPMQFEEEHLAMEVLVFSDMFDIRLLNRASQDFLRSKIRLANVIFMAEFAEHYHADILHERCLQFMGRKIKLLGSKSLVGLDTIASTSCLRRLIKWCNDFKLRDFVHILRSDNGTGLNRYVGTCGLPSWFPERPKMKYYGNRIIL
ncbi:hypothetical protein HDE_04727 [Halotydeus destructor]|nr:hypothetical protein HDE_04727 [Halotydeus destructor]